MKATVNRALVVVVVRVIFFCMVVCLASVGCATRYIPNTDVEDTTENRDIVAFCERYRKAVETQNVGLLLSYAAPDYYEDGGNVDPSDDLDFAGLREWLQNRFQETRAIRYEMRYRKVRKTKTRIYISYTYSASYKIPGLKDAEEWRHTVAENRLELVRDRGKQMFKIAAGM